MRRRRANQSAFSPRSVTEGMPQIRLIVYRKYFCIEPIMMIAAVTVSVGVVVEKLGMIQE
jgi:hypothetical protein